MSSPSGAVSSGRQSFELVLCANATPTVGAGHVMRLLVLAEAWVGLGVGNVSLYGEITLDFVEYRLASLGVNRRREPPRDIHGVLVVDTYDRELREAFAGSASGLRVLLDDVGGSVPEGYHLVWNPNAYGSAALYPDFRGEIVTGPDAVPVRSGLPLWNSADSRLTGVMVGGGEPPGLMLKALHLLAGELGEADLCGAGVWIPDSWRRADVREPWRALATCGRLITAAGSSIWEAAAVGVPVLVVRTAPNQDLVFDWAIRHGAPVVDALIYHRPETLANVLVETLSLARPLPSIRSGVDHVVEQIISSLAGDVRGH